jgi:hypothetical protein
MFSCGGETSNQEPAAQLPASDTLATATDVVAAIPDDQKAKFRAFLDGFYDLQLPLICDDVYKGDSLPLPDYELVDEFFNGNLDVPWFYSEAAHDMWTNGDDANHYRLLGKIEMDTYVLTFVEYETDSWSQYSGTYMTCYDYEGDILARTDFCFSWDIEKSGMIAFSSQKCKIDSSLNMSSGWSYVSQENGDEELGPEEYRGTITIEQLNDDGSIKLVSEKEYEGDEAKNLKFNF